MIGDEVKHFVLRAPFPWFGGKSRIAPLVWTRFGEVRNFVEPFAGSLACLLLRPQPFTGMETVNDLDGMVANFWRALQSAPDEVAGYADWPVNECVPAGTMIGTPSGDISVEEVRPGMTVWGERNGRIVPAVVSAVRQSEASEFFRVGPLRLTGNHPVWTQEHGYVEAKNLHAGSHVGIADYLANELDFVMLECDDGKSEVGNLSVARSENANAALSRHHLSREEALQRTPFSCRNRGQDAQGLLDSVADFSRSASRLDCDRVRHRGQLAKSGTRSHSRVPTIGRFGQPHGRGRRLTRLHPIAGVAGEVVADAEGCEVRAGASIGDARKTSLIRIAGEDTGVQHGAASHHRIESQAGTSSHGKDSLGRAYQETGVGKTWMHSLAGTQGEDRSIDNGPQDRRLRGDGAALCVGDASGSRDGGQRGIGQSGDPQRMSLQRESTPVRVKVYNFQTETANYFAAGILVHNCDLHARHLWLVNEGRRHVERLKTEPGYFDAKIAGWWVWGCCQWIGSGWCEHPEWKQRPHLGDAGVGVHRPSQQLPHLGDAGRGVHRPSQGRPHLGGGMGEHRPSQQLPHLGTAGMGVHRPRQQRPHLGNAGRGELHEYMNLLAARLRRVRVCCGDWSRICGPTPTVKQGLTAVFLDPPYLQSERDGELYAVETNVSADVRAWCLERGGDERIRVALCGYAGEGHEILESHGWDVVEWKTSGGYGRTGTAGTANAARERVWFSPHCVPAETAPDLFSELNHD